ncbi:MAG: sulfite dehydrogenase [Pseudolabrys sp.]
MTEPTETTRATRRRFLIGAAGLAATGMPAARAENAKNLPPNVAGWTRQLGEGVGVRAYGNPSKYEKDVIRRTVSWLTATPESSVSFTPLHQLDGIITPNGLCFERHHGGIAEIDPSDYRLMLHGMVDKSLIFTLDELKRLPRVNKIYFLECAANSGMEWRGAQLNGCQYTHGMVHCVQYTGVSLKVLLEQAGLKPNARWVMAEGGDAAAMNRSIPIEKALDDCIVAYRMNGEMLRPEQGYPVRLVVPGWEGNIWIKWLRRLKVSDQPWFTREETSKYTDLLENGKARQFTFVMDAKSVITSPSPQAPVKQKGFNVISGLAWSGRGKVKRVDISLDGGRNWRTARIDGPVFDKACVRFYYEFDWNGEELLLQSRAMDDTGYVQPSKDALRKIRGVNSIYHNNGIQTWAVKPDGEVENVEVG